MHGLVVLLKCSQSFDDKWPQFDNFCFFIAIVLVIFIDHIIYSIAFGKMFFFSNSDFILLLR